MLKKPYEMCYNIEEQYNDELILVYESKGQSISQNRRGSCYHKRYSKWILHTHPFISKAYPSGEDIVKVIKHEIIKNSLIVTSWGIWHIRKLRDRKNLDLEKLTQDTKKCVDSFYPIHKKFIEQPSRDQPISHISTTANKKIDDVIRYTNEILGDHIYLKLIRWSVLNLELPKQSVSRSPRRSRSPK